MKEEPERPPKEGGRKAQPKIRTALRTDQLRLISTGKAIDETVANEFRERMQTRRGYGLLHAESRNLYLRNPRSNRVSYVCGRLATTVVVSCSSSRPTMQQNVQVNVGSSVGPYTAGPSNARSQITRCISPTTN
ncbi:uncharacterized protein LOC112536846 [Ricinus communis]|uniref:uncharacterized protein LOC112536846 n=1 Tax=Ricinus communis TaxID=3988 RepID=UPI00201AA968|nr:uncharacterized protein LOC112536846 [Ricinus communis]